jgi:hypothetical protein
MNLPPPGTAHTPAQAEALLNQLLGEHTHGTISDAEIRALLPRLRWRDETGARYTLGFNSRTWYAWDGRGWTPSFPAPALMIDLDPEPAPIFDVNAPLEASPPAAAVGAAWMPTHAVPDGGMQAWAAPDPSSPPVAVLDARVELQLREQRGDWAYVVGSNGWSGWVDARGLVPR